MKFINLTPHDVTIVDGETKHTFPKQGLARVQTIPLNPTMLGGIPFFTTTYGGTEGLPEPQEGIIFIVSMVVAQANPERRDIVFPASDPANSVRDEKGNLIGFKALTRFPLVDKGK